MPRFILIDPPLTGTVGHHHEFAHNVLTAANEAGYEGLLAAHARSTVNECGGWPIRRTYRDGLWTHQAGNPWLRGLSYAASLLRRGGPRLEAWRYRVERARDGWRATRFARDTQGLLKGLSPTGDDVVFVPNATITEVVGLTRLFRRFPPALEASWHLEFHFNIFGRGVRHRPLERPATRALQAALRNLHKAAHGSRLALYTDTDELTAQYEALEAGPFMTLPIPVDPVYRPGPITKTGPQAPLRVAYVGDARGEKGYPQLPEMIGRVWVSHVESGRVQFVVQSNCRASRSEQAALAARERLAAFGAPEVQLLTEPLSSDEYRSLVLDADVLMLPYDPEAYDARSSGILSEALSAGKPVLVPEGTWMAAQLGEEIRRHRSELSCLGVWQGRGRPGASIAVVGPAGPIPRSIVGVVYPGGAAGLAQAIDEVVRHFDHYRTTAIAFSREWRERHQPRELVARLRQNAALRAPHFALRRLARSVT